MEPLILLLVSTMFSNILPVAFVMDSLPSSITFPLVPNGHPYDFYWVRFYFYWVLLRFLFVPSLFPMATYPLENTGEYFGKQRGTQ